MMIAWMDGDPLAALHSRLSRALGSLVPVCSVTHVTAGAALGCWFVSGN